MASQIISASLRALLHETIVSYGTDFIAEAIALGLEEHGIRDSDIFIKALGTKARGYRKDVSGYSVKEDAASGRQLLFLHTNREGMYDGLPEFIFHHSHVVASHCNTGAIRDEIKRFRKEEAAARLFFLPFEQEFFAANRALHRLDFKLDTINPDFALVDIFAPYWPILTRLPKPAAFVFLTMLPSIASMRNDLPLIGEKLSYLLQIPITLKLVESRYDAPMHAAPALGSGILGINTIIGTAVYDGEQDVCIQVLPDAERLPDFLAGGCMYGIIEELCGYFIGAEYGITVQMDCVQKEGTALVLEELVVGMGMRL